MLNNKLFLSLLMLFSTLTTYAYDFVSDGIYYSFYNKTEHTCKVVASASNSKYSGDIIIPQHVKYQEIEYSVTKIGDNAFENCISLQTITLPISCTEIGNNAFKGCTDIQAIELPSSIKSIGYYAFANCTDLQSITIPSGITKISNHTFSGCTDLKTISIPASVTEIETRAFENCTKLRTISLPPLLFVSKSL